MKITKKQLRKVIKEEIKLAGGMGHVPVPDPDLYDLGKDDGSAEERPNPLWKDNASYMKGYEDGQTEPRTGVTDSRALELEGLINGWITQPITVEFVRGNAYMIRGVEPAMVPEVEEEVEEFGGSVQAEISSGTTPGLKDLSIIL